MTGDHAIILAAHGCGDESNANGAVHDLARRLAGRTGITVEPAFNLGSPGFADAIDSIDARRIIVVPLMTSEGYFAREVLPQRCAQERSFDGRSVTIATPVGARPAVLEALAARTARTLEEYGAEPSTAIILVVGHGTRRNRDSGAATEDLAALLAERIPGTGARAVFLDQDPLLEDVAPTLEARTVVVIPFLLGGGGHAERDITERLGLHLAADEPPPRAVFQERRHVIFEPPLLGWPGLIECVEADVRERIDAPEIRLGTRRSRLALWQASRVREAIERTTGQAVSLVEIESSGDTDWSSPVEELPGESPFTEEIAAALASGAIDLATHSLKDLPLVSDPNMPVIGLLERGPIEEVLIAHDGTTLDDLPPDAVVGVSCARRAAQLVRLRPDLQPTSIRGPVDVRVGLVLSGRYDATILAAAGVERLGLERHITQRFTLTEMMPAAGQAAIAIQARADDVTLRDRVARVDHTPTHRAVTAELALARILEPEVDPLIVAAAAHSGANRDVTLRARIISRDGRMTVDETVHSPDPKHAAREAATALLKRLAHPSALGAAP